MTPPPTDLVAAMLQRIAHWLPNRATVDRS